MTEEAPKADPDTGLRQLLKWTAIALIAAVLFALVAVALVVRVFR